jgi:hypothetical protein
MAAWSQTALLLLMWAREEIGLSNDAGKDCSAFELREKHQRKA